MLSINDTREAVNLLPFSNKFVLNLSAANLELHYVKEGHTLSCFNGFC